MKWEDILKDEQSYGEMLGLIEKVDYLNILESSCYVV